ncbi:MAG TPA: alpha/beta hydrolase [Candidatus Saccharimonadales bacterium]
MKTVLLVPGFRENITSRDYASLIKVIERAGHKVRFVSIHWQRTTIDNWLHDLEAEYSKHKPEETILAGFSFGAMTAFVAAAKHNPAELWLFSLSPYFHEDIHSSHMRQSWLKHIGHRRVSAFDKLNFKELAGAIRCKTHIFVGRVEIEKWPDMKRRALDAEALIHSGKLTVIDGVGHDVADACYVAAIEQEV